MGTIAIMVLLVTSAINELEERQQYCSKNTRIS
jgi:hypothetical protein